MSGWGQTEKYSARGDLFRSSPKNGHWTPYFGEPSIELRRSIVMEYSVGPDKGFKANEKEEMPRDTDDLEISCK